MGAHCCDMLQETELECRICGSLFGVEELEDDTCRECLIDFNAAAMATGAPAGCDASESDCSPKLCSIQHSNVLALLHQYCSIAYTATVPSDSRQRGIKKGGRRRTGKLNQLRGQLTRASPGGPTQSCSVCANVDRQFNGLWSKLFTDVPQYISRSPKGKSTGHKRWCVFHSENEVFVSYT